MVPLGTPYMPPGPVSACWYPDQYLFGARNHKWHSCKNINTFVSSSYVSLCGSKERHPFKWNINSCHSSRCHFFRILPNMLQFCLIFPIKSQIFLNTFRPVFDNVDASESLLTDLPPQKYSSPECHMTTEAWNFYRGI